MHHEQHREMQSICHHGSNEEGGSQLYFGVGHKCTKSTLKLKDGGGST
jgi:hypothetical protein